MPYRPKPCCSRYVNTILSYLLNNFKDLKTHHWVQGLVDFKATYTTRCLVATFLAHSLPGTFITVFWPLTVTLIIDIHGFVCDRPCNVTQLLQWQKKYSEYNKKISITCADMTLKNMNYTFLTLYVTLTIDIISKKIYNFL